MKICYITGNNHGDGPPCSARLLHTLVVRGNILRKSKGVYFDFLNIDELKRLAWAEVEFEVYRIPSWWAAKDISRDVGAFFQHA